MSQDRVDNLFASESWTTVYTAFTNVSLKAYDFDTIRAALIDYVATTYPDKFNDFIASSEFIAILDLVAYLGHSLSFRLDMNTRENFLDTAERRESILRMAKTLGYNKTRPTNARGFLKITSVTTDQPIADNEGNSLANRIINWNDSNNADWYENFIDVINAALSSSSKIQDPMASTVIAGVENYLYEINQADTSRAVSFSFNAPVSGANRRFEAVRTTFEDDKIIEAEPIETQKFTIVNRNDNLGPASDRTGFFVYAKTGTLKFENFSYATKISNLIETIATGNISNTDVWVQRVDSTNTYSSSVTKVDNDTRETAVYNSLRTGNGDLVSVSTIDNNAIELHYGDGVFGNAASGNYRVWYRVADNQNYRVGRDDVQDKTISIPYTGADNKNYRLVLTVSTTRDFSENFAAESYTSVRRIAPRAYYAQDRMVNAQDYNVLPLSLGSNIVSKVKAVNTTYAGNSRYFEMDDVTGHHSNISITGTDGSVYIDSDVDITMNLRFDRRNGNATDFIRNEITKAIRHPSLVNHFYAENKDKIGSIIDVKSTGYEIDPTDPKGIKPNPGLETAVWSGDFVKLVSETGKEYWTRVNYGDDAPVGSFEFKVTDIIPETSGNIEQIVRGYRTRFDDPEIQNIKSKMLDDTSFIIQYVYDGFEWVWDVYDDSVNDTPDSGVFLELSYTPGIRENEAEYTVTFTGSKIVFESADQVKFHYGNEEMVVDNETNLAERDSLLINYLSDDSPSIDTQGGDNYTITLGHNKIYDYNQVDKTFKVDFRSPSGGKPTYEFFVDRNYVLSDSSYHVVSPEGSEYTLRLDANPTIDEDINDNGIIGNEDDTYIKEFKLDDINDIPGAQSQIADNEEPEDSNDFVISSDYLTAIVPAASCVTTHITTVSSVDFEGAKGDVSTEYFNDAGNKGKFIWINEDALPGDVTVEEATETDSGVTAKYIAEKVGTRFNFTFEGIYHSEWGVTGVSLNDLTSDNYLGEPSKNAFGTDGYVDSVEDGNIKWKQIAFAEITFVTNEEYTDINELVFKNSSNDIIENKHLELVSLGDTTNGFKYKVIFWTKDPNSSSIDVFRFTDDVIDMNDYMLRADVVVTERIQVEDRTKIYNVVESYIYDKFISIDGYIDNSKVKLLHTDIEKNPYSLIDISSESKIILETYDSIVGNNFERVSSKSLVSNDIDTAPNGIRIHCTYDPEEQTYIWHTRDNDSDPWHETPGFSSATFEDNYAKYRVVDGISSNQDPFMSFRWDHYAEKDKRIDPSTSNIIDMYVLTADYVRNINEWAANGFGEIIPAVPNNFELRKIMEPLEEKSAIADHVSYIPVKFKMLFGEYADAENRAVFKVIPKLGTVYTSSEIKNVVAKKVNQYFNLDNWDFGEQFYFSELAAYLHQELSDYISSVTITPRYAGNDFKNLLSISCEQNEIFLSVVTSKDVKIISSIADNELTGE